MSVSWSLQPFGLAWSGQNEPLVTEGNTAVSVRESGVRRRVDKAAEWRTGSRPKCASAGSPYKFRVPAQAVKSQFR